MIEYLKKEKRVLRYFKIFGLIFNINKQNLLLLSAITGCVSISAFASLADIPAWIASSVAGLKTCVIAAEIKSISQ